MDLRIERTRRNIAKAFIELRAQQPIERITIKELAARAEINKATFYLHYRDIYDLSEHLEDEILDECLAEIPVELLLRTEGYRLLAERFLARRDVFSILFSGSRIERAVRKLDERIKALIFIQRPDWKGDSAFSIRLTASIYGGFYSYFLHQEEDFEMLVSTLSDFAIRPFQPR